MHYTLMWTPTAPSTTALGLALYGFMPDYHFCNFVPYKHGFIEAVMTTCQEAFVGFVPIRAYEPMKGYCMGQLGERFGDLEGFEGQIAIRIVHH